MKIDKTGLVKVILIAFVVCVSMIMILDVGIIIQLSIIAAFIILIMLLRPIWISDNYGENRLLKYILRITLAIALATLPMNIFKDVIVQYLKTTYPNIFGDFTSQHVSIVSMFIFVFLIILLVTINLINRRNSFGRRNLRNQAEIDYGGLKNLIKYLKDDVNILNQEANWSSDHFTPLDVEIEVEIKSSYTSKTKRIGNLFKEFNKSNKELILLLGDPGSGKSVALRYMVEKLYDNAHKNNILPLYVNLRGLVLSENVDLISIEDFKEFVLETIFSAIGNYEPYKTLISDLLRSKKIVFFFDSFDEVPVLLDANEESAILKKLSDVIVKFARLYGLQTIIASRYYRKPRSSSIDVKATIFEIRPFSEKKIIETIRNHGINNKSIIKKLFLERDDLVSVVRTPLMAMLFIRYLKANKLRLPENSGELFDDFIGNLVEDTFAGSKEAVYEFCERIALEIYSNEEEGYEISLSNVFDLENFHRRNVLQFLTDCRLGRLSKSKKFSFVHRRFAEYFTVRLMQQKKIPVILDDIFSDGKTRDALVFYTSIIESKKSKAIAEVCYSKLIENNSLSQNGIINKQGVHTLRFLSEAFRGRKETIAHLQDGISNFIDNNISKESDLISLKIALEAIGLLNEEQIQDTIVKASSFDIAWINDTALSACRYISSVSPNVSESFRNHYIKQPIYQIFFNESSILFSLKLSDAFRLTRYLLSFFKVSVLLNFILLIFFFFTMPLLSGLVVVLPLGYHVFSNVIARKKEILAFKVWHLKTINIAVILLGFFVLIPRFSTGNEDDLLSIFYRVSSFFDFLVENRLIPFLIIVFLIFSYDLMEVVVKYLELRGQAECKIRSL